MSRAVLPKIAKRDSGRSSRLPAPVSIRVFGAHLHDRERLYIRRKLGDKLAKAASSIERVSVRITDENGPRGGVDQVCRIKVVIAGLPSVIVERRAATLVVAVDAAIRAAERAVMSTVRRRKSKPRRASKATATRQRARARTS